MRFLRSMLLPMIAGVAVGAFPAAAQDAAHALAQKFALEQQRKTPKVPAHKSAAAERVKPGTLAQASKPALPPKTTAAQDYEAEMLAAARAEAEARRRAQSDSAAAKTAPAPSPPVTSPNAGPAAPAVAAPATSPSTPAPGPAAAPPRIKIEAKIKTPAVSPAAVKVAAPAQEVQPREDAKASAPPEAGAATASILVVLTHATDGEGSMPKTFDPIVCFGEICFVSGGYDAPARTIARKDALSTKNTITAGAGACAGKGRCAFRGVPVRSGSDLQIVDLGLVRHDKRDTVAADVDTTCGVESSDLFCNKPLTAPDYRIWVVPESVASTAGAKAIESALADELPEENLSLDTDK